MAHYAKIENGLVVEVIVAEADFITTLDGVWVQASYNTHGGVHYKPNSSEPSDDQSKALRKNYPSRGDVYDATRDAFYRPQPFKSWMLNESTCYWEAPVPYPNDDKQYMWDEKTQQWVLAE